MVFATDLCSKCRCIDFDVKHLLFFCRDLDNEHKSWIKENDNMEEEGVSFTEDGKTFTN